jgi:hypothetical protein
MVAYYCVCGVNTKRRRKTGMGKRIKDTQKNNILVVS